MLTKGVGNRSAKIVIVGECFGSTEQRSGIPFSGPSGHLLNTMLNRAGISRNECYVTNVINIQPPGNNFGVFYIDSKRKKPNPILIAAREFLLNDIKEINPNVIIALGGEALKALTSMDSIKKWRGSIINTELGKVIPTYHPAFILRMYKHRSVCELDLVKARKQSYTKEYEEIKYNFKLKPIFKDVMDFIDAGHKTLAFDIETIGEHTRCLGFAWNGEDAICIPFLNIQTQTNYWSLEEETTIVKRLNVLFKDIGIEEYAQNFPFDATVLSEDFGFNIQSLKMDTMIAHNCCYSELPKSLDFLTSIYTNIPYAKGYNVKNDMSTWEYNCWDCICTFRVAIALEKEMKDLRVFDYYTNERQPLTLALTNVGNRGVLIDTKLRQDQTIKSELKISELEQQLLDVTGMIVNPNSPKQIKELLYGTLKMRPVISRKTHVATTDEEAILSLRIKYPEHKRIFNLIIDHRKTSKLLGTFLKSRLNNVNRLQTSYKPAGTTGARISSQKTIFGLGGDLQQIPRGEFRKMFIAPPGKDLIKVDLSQAEARAVAWFAQIQNLIFNFQDPKFDIHTWTGAMFLNKEKSLVTKQERQDTKGTVHGINYGRGAKSISRDTGTPFNLVQQRIILYKAVCPELAIWHQWITNEIIKTRQLRTPSGRLRIFMDRLNDETFRSAFSFLPQSLVADIINRALVKLVMGILPEECFVILQVHDELVIEAPIPLIQECIKLIKDTCQQDIIVPPITIPLKIPIDIKVGHNWHDMKEVL